METRNGMDPALLEKEPSLNSWLKFIAQNRASDFHIGEGISPSMRVDGDLVYLSKAPFSQEYMRRLIRESLTDDRLRVFYEEKELDYSFGVTDVGRFRVNLFFQRGAIGAAIRALPFNPMSFEEIGFRPAPLNTWCHGPAGWFWSPVPRAAVKPPRWPR